MADYGWEHQQIRARTKPHAYGKPCTRCGNTLTRDPDDPIELDHDDEGRGYRGWSHRSCNRRAGALKALRRLPPEGTTSRDW